MTLKRKEQKKKTGGVQKKKKSPMKSQDLKMKTSTHANLLISFLLHMSPWCSK